MTDNRPDNAAPIPGDDRDDRIGRSCVVILGMLWIVVALSVVRNSWHGCPAAVGAPPAAINPNDAPWYELALLPRIGEAKARAVVACREARRSAGHIPPFAAPSDLTEVSGIGPKTVERIAGELRFHD